MDPTGHGPALELILRHGRHAGTRRKLTGPLTLVGSAPGCELQLTESDVAAHHCLIAQTADGVLVRDLNASPETLVNGRSVVSAELRDGDVLSIGSCRFEVSCRLPNRAAERALVAALAAQQVELHEAEANLEQRRQEWQGQENRLAVQLEHKRRELEALDERCKHAEAAVRGQRQRLNGELIQGRQDLKEAWLALRQARFRWKHRRGNERAALRLRARELEDAALQLTRVRQQLQREQAAWTAQRRTLEDELDGLNQRVLNQRQLLRAEPDLSVQETPARSAGAEEPVAAPTVPPISEQSAVDARVVDLDALARALDDQRLVLVETWGRLGQVHARWHEERAAAAAELQTLAERLFEEDLHLQGREQAALQTEALQRERHEELVRLHRQIVAWRARLRGDEETWEHDKNRLLAELRHKEAAAEKQTAALSELRQRWQRQRKQEVQELRSEREALEAFRQGCAKLRQELIERAAKLEDEKRIWTEKMLALEQHRREMLAAAADEPQAERRLERLRRRWITQNADAIRAFQRERTALQNELLTLEARYDALQQRSVTLKAAEAALADKQSAWEEKHLHAEARERRLEQELQHAGTQRELAQQHSLALRDEVERIARALLDEPDPPLAPVVVPRAA
jgi:hypothetical protein